MLQTTHNIEKLEHYLTVMQEHFDEEIEIGKSRSGIMDLLEKIRTLTESEYDLESVFRVVHHADTADSVVDVVDLDAASGSTQPIATDGADSAKTLDESFSENDLIRQRNEDIVNSRVVLADLELCSHELRRHLILKNFDRLTYPIQIKLLKGQRPDEGGVLYLEAEEKNAEAMKPHVEDVVASASGEQLDILLANVESAHEACVKRDEIRSLLRDIKDKDGQLPSLRALPQGVDTVGSEDHDGEQHLSEDKIEADNEAILLDVIKEQLEAYVRMLRTAQGSSESFQSFCNSLHDELAKARRELMELCWQLDDFGSKFELVEGQSLDAFLRIHVLLAGETRPIDEGRRRYSDPGPTITAATSLPRVDSESDVTDRLSSVRPASAAGTSITVEQMQEYIARLKREVAREKQIVAEGHGVDDQDVTTGGALDQNGSTELNEVVDEALQGAGHLGQVADDMQNRVGLKSDGAGASAALTGAHGQPTVEEQIQSHVSDCLQELQRSKIDQLSTPSGEQSWTADDQSGSSADASAQGRTDSNTGFVHQPPNPLQEQFDPMVDAVERSGSEEDSADFQQCLGAHGQLDRNSDTTAPARQPNQAAAAAGFDPSHDHWPKYSFDAAAPNQGSGSFDDGSVDVTELQMQNVERREQHGQVYNAIDALRGQLDDMSGNSQSGMAPFTPTTRTGTSGASSATLLKKIFGYEARCEFLVKIGLRFWILVGYVDFLAKFGAKLSFRV